MSRQLQVVHCDASVSGDLLVRHHGLSLLWSERHGAFWYRAHVDAQPLSSVHAGVLDLDCLHLLVGWRNNDIHLY